MQTTFSDIIAKVVILVDYFLECFVTVTYDNGTLANCSGGSYTGTITNCGYQLISALTSLTVQGLGVLSSVMAGLNVQP